MDWYIPATSSVELEIADCDSVICLLVHGLGGTSQEAYLKNFASMCHARGWRAASFDYWLILLPDFFFSSTPSSTSTHTSHFSGMQAPRLWRVARTRHLCETPGKDKPRRADCHRRLLRRDAHLVPLLAGTFFMFFQPPRLILHTQTVGKKTPIVAAVAVSSVVDLIGEYQNKIRC